MMEDLKQPDRAEAGADPIDPKAMVLGYVSALRLESASATMVRFGVTLEKMEISPIIAALKAGAASARSKGEIRKANRLERRARAVTIFRDHGLDPVRLIPPADIREGDTGKILLVSISGGAGDGLTCLRSGDLWHHEILQDAVEEIQDLGFENAVVDSAGGARVRFDSVGTIHIYGTSDAFGECDKQAAASLIRQAFPSSKICIDPPSPG